MSKNGYFGWMGARKKKGNHSIIGYTNDKGQRVNRVSADQMICVTLVCGDDEEFVFARLFDLPRRNPDGSVSFTDVRGNTHVLRRPSQLQPPPQASHTAAAPAE